jgi:CRP/FNR family cyclic AMP-dependent transcriptional regulator
MTVISRRARLAPRQKCVPPPPKPTMSVAFLRSMSNRARVVEDRLVPVGRPVPHDDLLAGRDLGVAHDNVGRRAHHLRHGPRTVPGAGLTDAARASGPGRRRAKPVLVLCAGASASYRVRVRHRPDGHAVIVAALTGSYLFGALPADVITALATTATVRRLSRNEALFEPGDVADELYVVVAGQLKDSVINVDGDEVVYFVFEAGQTVGEPGYFAAERDRMVRLTATVPSEVVCLHRRHLEPVFAEYPVLKDQVLERLASNARLQANMFAALATRPLADRLVLRLLELVESNRGSGQGPARTPSISQATLAAMVGVSRENVNRALSALVTEGVIRRDRGGYVLVDEAALREIVAQDFHPARPRDIR